MMIDASTSLPQQPFRVFSVFGRSFTVLFRNIVPFGIIALVLNLPFAVWDYATSPAPGLHASYSFAGWQGIVGLIIGLICSYLLTAALVFGTVRDLRGNRATVGECLQYGVPLIGKILVLSLLFGILVGLGMIALVIPGIVLVVVYWVLIPVAVVEQETIGGSFRRAAYLSQGSRWRIFGLLMLFSVCYYVLMVVIIGGVTAAVLSGAESPGDGMTGIAFVSWIVAALLGGFSSILYAVSYHDLRVAKEGVDINQIAAVFD